MATEREKLEGELRGIQAKRQDHDEAHKRAIREEEDSDDVSMRNLNQVNRLLEHWQSDPVVFGLLSNQWKGMKETQHARRDLVEEITREAKEKRRELDEQEEACRSRLRERKERNKRGSDAL